MPNLTAVCVFVCVCACMCMHAHMCVGACVDRQCVVPHLPAVLSVLTLTCGSMFLFRLATLDNICPRHNVYGAVPSSSAFPS